MMDNDLSDDLFRSCWLRFTLSGGLLIVPGSVAIVVAVLSGLA
jgi:hypothetical protein